RLANALEGVETFHLQRVARNRDDRDGDVLEILLTARRRDDDCLETSSLLCVRGESYECWDGGGQQAAHCFGSHRTITPMAFFETGSTRLVPQRPRGRGSRMLLLRNVILKSFSRPTRLVLGFMGVLVPVVV